MKKNVRFSAIYLLFVLALSAAFVSGCSCSASKPAADPLAGWQGDFNEQPNQIIVNDYQNYIKQLPTEEGKSVLIIGWLKNGSGQHAIKIKTGTEGPDWEHILIYDKDNKRIKTIKYLSGHSYS
jgi:hypothetical protein